MVTAVTSAGKSVTGIRLNEDSFTIQIKDAAGRISSFRKRDLRELEKATGQTPMPAFASILPSADLQDLVAFLATSRETP
jgi:hypothetical protein